MSEAAKRICEDIEKLADPEDIRLVDSKIGEIIDRQIKENLKKR